MRRTAQDPSPILTCFGSTGHSPALPNSEIQYFGYRNPLTPWDCITIDLSHGTSFPFGARLSHIYFLPLPFLESVNSSPYPPFSARHSRTCRVVVARHRLRAALVARALRLQTIARSSRLRGRGLKKWAESVPPAQPSCRDASAPWTASAAPEAAKVKD